MTVDKIFGTIIFKQISKAFEASVGYRVKIVDMSRRGVGDQDIEAFMLSELKPQFSDPAAHLLSVYIYFPSL